MYRPADEANLDLFQLTRDLDKVKADVFVGKNAAFLGSVMCSLNFTWTEDVATAATNGINLWWNPHWFSKLPHVTRRTVLIHELWHVARLHPLRLGDRNAEDFNHACDYLINNGLENEGYSFEGTQPTLDHQYDGMAEEEIYDLIQAQPQTGPAGSFDPNGGMDIVPLTLEEKHTVINQVVAAVHQAKLAGEGGNLPGDIEQVIKQFLEPVIPWQAVLQKFFTELLDEDFSWKKPNRRYQDVYMPSRCVDEGRLEHLMYFLDVSGSVSDADVVRFNSEVKYIKDVYEPTLLTLVLFDTKIQKVYEFTPEDPFDQVVIIGRGGTSLVCVKNYIDEHLPTAAIIFSDLFCRQMQPLEHEVPVIWVAVGNKNAVVPFGELIHIKG